MRKNIYYLLKANISNLIHNYAYPRVHYLYTDSFPSVRVNRTYTQELISHFLLYLPYIIRLLTAVRATALPLIMFKLLFWHRQIRRVYERRKKGIFTQKCVAFLLYGRTCLLILWEKKNPKYPKHEGRICKNIPFLHLPTFECQSPYSYVSINCSIWYISFCFSKQKSDTCLKFPMVVCE